MLLMLLGKSQDCLKKPKNVSLFFARKFTIYLIQIRYACKNCKTETFDGFLKHFYDDAFVPILQSSFIELILEFLFRLQID